MPDFSIIVPTYARPENLKTCLDALCRLDYPGEDFEVLIVDDGGPDRLDNLVDAYRPMVDITLLRQANAGPATARNTGAGRARGHYLAFTDDDCAPAPDWLAQLQTHLDGAHSVMVGGRTVNGLPHNHWSAASQALIDYLYVDGRDSAGNHRFIASNNMAMPAVLFESLGGFDTDYPRAAGEDRDFCDRWLAQGYRITHARDAIVTHYHRLGPKSFWRQHSNYGRGAYALRSERARQQETTMRLDSLAFYTGLIRHPFFSQRLPRALSLSFLLAVAQLATASGFFVEAWRDLYPAGSR